MGTSYAVRFEAVTKRYRGPGPRYASFRQEINDGLRRLGVRPVQHSPHTRGRVALDAVSFEVPEGESLGIIGPNGAGKTTALKLISRITYPTGGRVRVRGRVGALIEVGAGIHPELTGRENIWLYGRILGMSKAEIRRHFDEIVAFAELGNVVDTPVKMYSSGMQLRLGFAVASHLDPDIFVVDEGLAVGDAGFQVRCVERMSRLVAEGRTLLFVSHSLPLVREVCSRCLLIDAGQVVHVGPAGETIDCYLKRVSAGLRHSARSGEVIEVVGVRAIATRSDSPRIATSQPMRVEIELLTRDTIPDAVLGVGITDGRPGNLVSMSMLSAGQWAHLQPGRHVLECVVAHLPLLPNIYEIWFSALSADQATFYTQPRPVGTFLVADGPKERKRDLAFTRTGAYGPVHVPYEMSVRMLHTNGTPPISHGIEDRQVR